MTYFVAITLLFALWLAWIQQSHSSKSPIQSSDTSICSLEIAVYVLLAYAYPLAVLAPQPWGYIVIAELYLMIAFVKSADHDARAGTKMLLVLLALALPVITLTLYNQKLRVAASPSAQPARAASETASPDSRHDDQTTTTTSTTGSSEGIKGRPQGIIEVSE